jgi:hypothetical protein
MIAASVVRHALFGFLLGFFLSRIGFSDYDQVHRMFLFTDLRLFLTFCAAVAVAGIGFLAVSRRTLLPPRMIHPGTLLGSVAFGMGWALIGACPGVAFVQIGEGKLAALASVGGIVLGNWIYGRVHRRFFRWDVGNCG